MMTFKYVAHLDDGTSYEVTADQRDVAEFEVQPFGAGWFQAVALKPFTFARFVAWAALKRERRTALTWDEWRDRCVEVEGVEEPAEGTSQDPGQPVASAGN